MQVTYQSKPFTYQIITSMDPRKSIKNKEEKGDRDADPIATPTV
jgi:hypothetical protein